jgi:hypothetical protein
VSEPAPSDLPFRTSFFKSKTDVVPVVLDMSWDTLTHRLSQYDFRLNKDGPLFSPAEYAPDTTRSLANVLRVHFLGLDFDHISDEAFDFALTKLNGTRCCVYATWSQAESKKTGVNSYRVIIALSRPVPAQEWPRFFSRASAKFGGKNDKACKDSARMFYLPSMPLGAEGYAWFDTEEGEPLDVDAVLAEREADSPETIRDRKELQLPSVEVQEAFSEKAQRQLAKAVKTIAAIKAGEPRHPVINRLTFALGKLCPHFLDESIAYGRLVEAVAKMADPLPPERADDEIRRALADGMKSPDNPMDDWRGLLIRTGKEMVIAPTASNLVTILLHDERWTGVFGYDERLCKTAFLREPPFPPDISLGETPDSLSVFGGEAPYPRYLDSHDLMTVRMAIERQYRISFPQTVAVGEAVDRVSRERSFDPVLQYLEGLKWDGSPRVYAWTTTYLGVPDTEFTRVIGEQWLIQSVARTYKPGCQADSVLVLEGAQGVRKTTALKILGGRWFTDSVGDPKNKDTYINLLGKWIIELAELDALKRAESSAYKNFITNRDDYFREPYGRHSTSHPRRCVFAGSTNEKAYLHDGTGNRRFQPLEVTNVDSEALTRDRDQLWAEAVVMMKAGKLWYLEKEAHLEQAKAEQEKRFSADEWESLIGEYLDDNACQQITVAALLLNVLRIEANKWTRSDQMRVSDCLQRLGWERRRVTEGNARPWHYFPVPNAKVKPPEKSKLSHSELATKNLFRGRAVMGPAVVGSNVIPFKRPEVAQAPAPSPPDREQA